MISRIHERNSRPFGPAEFHMKLPSIAWKSIYTTNYDLIIEKTYQNYKNRKQDLITIKKNGERIEDHISSSNTLLYFKLHGCISSIHDNELPLILTTEQYIDHRKNRNRLFSRLKEAAYEYPIIFIGYSIKDADIRAILKEIDEELGTNKMRSYLILPSIKPQERRLWETKKVSCIEATFEDFLNALDGNISQEKQQLTFFKKEMEHPIVSRCNAFEKDPLTDRLRNFLENEVTFIHKDLKCTGVDPKSFYKGYSNGFGPIIDELDLRRDLVDNILSESILEEERNLKERQQLVLIKGHAGSGKTVLLKRLAWESSVEYDKICFYAQDFGSLDYFPLLDIYKKANERLFLFVDRCSLYDEQLLNILDKAKQDNFPITIVSTERQNTWNGIDAKLKNSVTNSYDVLYLNSQEIDRLLILLKKHDSLGYLKNSTHGEQKIALQEKLGRQLLVALHEATMGKPFQEIIINEYNSITSPQAKSLYLTISILHRLNILVRAGVIARVHGISFTSFKEEFFEPLEFITFATYNKKIQDFVYQTRHPHIAEIVFNSILTSEEDRYEEYLRLLSVLDTDYSADRDAFIGLTKAKELVKLFNIDLIRGVYDAALEADPKNAMTYQQYAIAEQKHVNGDINKSESLLEKAYELAPWSLHISHSIATLELNRANNASSMIEKKKRREESRKITMELVNKNPNESYAHHTLIKIAISELKDLIEENSEPPILQKKIKAVEQIISRAISILGQDEFILTAESNFSTLLKDYPRALESMKAAFKANPRSSYLASRLAKYYLYSDNISEAFITVQKCLELNSNDQDLHLQYAKLLIEDKSQQLDQIIHHLSHSYTKKDHRHNAQFMHAAYLYLNDQRDEANEIFTLLINSNAPIQSKQHPDFITHRKEKEGFRGKIVKLEYSHGFIERDGIGDWLFFHSSKCNLDYKQLRISDIVQFELAFTYRGACAVNLRN